LKIESEAFIERQTRPPSAVIARHRVGASRDPLARNASKLESGFPPRRNTGRSIIFRAANAES
jgi:hypothetical protein